MKDKCPKQPQTNYLGLSREWGGCLSGLKWTTLLSCVTVVISYFILPRLKQDSSRKCQVSAKGGSESSRIPLQPKSMRNEGNSPPGVTSGEIKPSKWEQSNGHLVKSCQTRSNKCWVQITSFSDWAEIKMNKIQKVKCWIGYSYCMVLQHSQPSALQQWPQVKNKANTLSVLPYA